MSRTAVVILNYNGEKLLRLFLPSVLQFSGDAEVIVADNASTDHSIAILQREFPSVRTILLDQNYGFCGGYNRALKQVDADYYVLLNSDIEVTPGWLEPMIRMLDTRGDVACVQPKILSYHERNKFEHAGAAGGFIDSFGYPFCRGRVFDQVESDHGQYNDEIEIFWSTGACMMIRSNLYQGFQGFDEDFFAHMEEIDLCWKLHRIDQKVMYCGNSTIYHVGAGTLGYGNPRKTYLNFRNGLSLIFKHLNPVELVFKLPIRVLLDWIAAIRFLAKKDSANARAVFKAHRDFYKNLGRDMRKRSENRKINGGYSRATIKRGSIIFDFYILGRKEFVQ